MPVLEAEIPSEVPVCPFDFVPFLADELNTDLILMPDFELDFGMVDIFLQIPKPEIYSLEHLLMPGGIEPIGSTVWHRPALPLRSDIDVYEKSIRLVYPVRFHWPEIPVDVSAPNAHSHTFAYWDETLFSLVQSIGWAVPTQSYNDPHIHRCLIHFQGHEILRKWDFPPSPAVTMLLQSMHHDFQVTPQRPAGWYEVPTVQEWNESFDKEMRRIHYEKNPQIRLIHALIHDINTRDPAYEVLRDLELHRKTNPHLPLSVAQIISRVSQHVGNHYRHQAEQRRERDVPQAEGTSAGQGVSRRVRMANRKIKMSSDLAIATASRPVRKRATARPRSEYPRR